MNANGRNTKIRLFSPLKNAKYSMCQKCNLIECLHFHLQTELLHLHLKFQSCIKTAGNCQSKLHTQPVNSANKPQNDSRKQTRNASAAKVDIPSLRPTRELIAISRSFDQRAPREMYQKSERKSFPISHRGLDARRRRTKTNSVLRAKYK
jgi:hypothetical protein